MLHIQTVQLASRDIPSSNYITKPTKKTTIVRYCASPCAVDEATAAPGDQDYLVIALAVGIPASVVILALVIVITAMFILMLRKSR